MLKSVHAENKGILGGKNECLSYSLLKSCVKIDFYDIEVKDLRLFKKTDGKV